MSSAVWCTYSETDAIQLPYDMAIFYDYMILVDKDCWLLARQHRHPTTRSEYFEKVMMEQENGLYVTKREISEEDFERHSRGLEDTAVAMTVYRFALAPGLNYDVCCIADSMRTFYYPVLGKHSADKPLELSLRSKAWVAMQIQRPSMWAQHRAKRNDITLSNAPPSCLKHFKTVIT